MKISTNPFLKGFCVHVDESIAEEHQDVLYAGVKYYGGSFSFEYIPGVVTHVITLTRREAVQTGEGPAFVHHCYLTDMFKVEKLLDQNEPEYLMTITSDNAANSMSNDQAAAPLATTRAEERLLEGQTFFIDPEYVCAEETLQHYRSEIIKAGGLIHESHEHAKYVITKFKSSTCFKAVFLKLTPETRLFTPRVLRHQIYLESLALHCAGF